MSLARVVRIPLTTLSSQETGRSAPNDVNTLMASTGGPDAPPDGLAAFDVFDDGTFLIADPLGKRLAIFDAKGKFQRELTIGLAVDDVAIMPNGLVRVRDSHTGETILFDRQGQQSTSENTAQSARRVVRLYGNFLPPLPQLLSSPLPPHPHQHTT